MPVYTYLVGGHRYRLWAKNMFEAEEDIYDEWGQYPDTIEEAR